jgi:hypothetical protein
LSSLFPSSLFFFSLLQSSCACATFRTDFSHPPYCTSTRYNPQNVFNPSSQLFR